MNDSKRMFRRVLKYIYINRGLKHLRNKLLLALNSLLAYTSINMSRYSSS